MKPIQLNRNNVQRLTLTSIMINVITNLHNILILYDNIFQNRKKNDKLLNNIITSNLYLL